MMKFILQNMLFAWDMFAISAPLFDNIERKSSAIHFVHRRPVCFFLYLKYDILFVFSILISVDSK